MVEMITPDRFLTLPMPGYAQIRLAVAPRFNARRMLDEYRPDIVHIATEGPIGWAARGWCRSRGVPYTSAFHTRFPEYLALRSGLSAEWFWPVMQRFHGASRAIMVATPSLDVELAARGIRPGGGAEGSTMRNSRPQGQSAGNGRSATPDPA
jgi:hypothetical protein